MIYADKYTRIKPETISLVKELIIDKKYFRQDKVTKLQHLNTLLTTLNGVYRTETRIQTTKETTNGYYNLTDKTIYLNKLSLVTFLHEYKHSLQHQKNKPNNEEVARGWSVSLFKQASLRHYERAKAKGILLYS